MKYHIIPVTDFNQNCSLVWCKQTKEAAIVDPGGETKKIIYQIKNLDIFVKKIFLTHGHIDHVGSARELSLIYKIPVIGPHKNEKTLLDELPNQCLMFGVDTIAPLIPDMWLSDGDIVHVGKLSFSVIHCPGHSPGHIILWNKINNFVLSGDILFRGSIGRTDLPGGNKQTLMKSIYKFMDLLSDNTIFLPGHGSISTIGNERHNNPFLLVN